jgi:hypothetical protein
VAACYGSCACPNRVFDRPQYRGDITIGDSAISRDASAGRGEVRLLSPCVSAMETHRPRYRGDITVGHGAISRAVLGGLVSRCGFTPAGTKDATQAAISPRYHCGRRRDIAGRRGRAGHAVWLRCQRDSVCTGRDIAAISPWTTARYRGPSSAGRRRGAGPYQREQRMRPRPRYRGNITVSAGVISRPCSRPATRSPDRF